MSMTESALRRAAWVSFAFCCGCYLLGVTTALLPSADAQQDRGLSISGAVLSVIVFAFPLAGVLITRRDPRNRIGWLMLGLGVIAFPLDFYIQLGLRVMPGSLPGAEVVAALNSAMWAPVLGLIGTFLILLFPDGRLPSRRWRFVGWFSAAAIVYVYTFITILPGPIEVPGVAPFDNPLGIQFFADRWQRYLLSILVLPVSMVLCAAGLVLRFRRSSGIERLQLKWLASAAAVVGLLYAVAMVTSLLNDVLANPDAPDPGWVLVIQETAVMSFVLIPCAVGVAMLKHGLYEIDVVINKALVFGALASFITAVYVAIVVGAGSLVGRGDRPNLALSIAATAVVAVAFQPVRERVQRFANRLVYGARATPYEVLSNFADRVGGSYDAAELLPMMARTVAQGVGARRVEVWLAIGPRLLREATWPDASELDESSRACADAVAELRGDRVVEVRHQGELLGAITVTKAPGEVVTPAERKLLDDVAAQAGLVLRNVRLIEELRSSRQRLVTAQDQERRRLERNLHDGAQQSLVSVALMIRTVRARLGSDGTTLGPALDQASEQLRTAIDELRELARGIHPAILTERGLSPALRSLAERSPVPVVIDDGLQRRLDPTVEATCYFVVAEALANVAKYAQASEVTVTLSQSGDELTLVVSDDGIGGANAAAGSGLAGLVDRLAVVDGTLELDSPNGGGTRLFCRIPVTAVPAEAPGATDRSSTRQVVGAQL